MSASRRVRILPQPDDTTCGPTCLQALYSFHGDEIPLERVIREVEPLDTYGTLGVLLAHHALRRGYSATIYTYNLNVFDPSWFRSEDDRSAIPDRLRRQAAAKRDDSRLRFATDAYLEFLTLGGTLRFEELTPELLRNYLEAGRPLLTGLSATYLYACQRERGESKLIYDDIAGVPAGHFVVLSGYESGTDQVLVSDPLGENPRYEPHYYRIGMQRVIGAILLGVITYDANFLVIEPEAGAARPTVVGARGAGDGT